MQQVKKNTVDTIKSSSKPNFKSSKRILVSQEISVMKKLYNWTDNWTNKKKNISNRLLHLKAIKINSKLGYNNNFKASEKWIRKFRKLFGVYSDSSTDTTKLQTENQDYEKDTFSSSNSEDDSLLNSTSKSSIDTENMCRIDTEPYSNIEGNQTHIPKVSLVTDKTNSVIDEDTITNVNSEHTVPFKIPNENSDQAEWKAYLSDLLFRIQSYNNSCKVKE